VKLRGNCADLGWRTGLAWPGLDWPGLDWTGLDWPGLDWPGLAWSGLAWPGPEKSKEGGGEVA
jgi:hypothetical protein